MHGSVSHPLVLHPWLRSRLLRTGILCSYPQVHIPFVSFANLTRPFIHQPLDCDVSNTNAKCQPLFYANITPSTPPLPFAPHIGSPVGRDVSGDGHHLLSGRFVLVLLGYGLLYRGTGSIYRVSSIDHTLTNPITVQHHFRLIQPFVSNHL